jgi:hypothetical protein
VATKDKFGFKNPAAAPAPALTRACHLQGLAAANPPAKRYKITLKQQNVTKHH